MLPHVLFSGASAVRRRNAQARVRPGDARRGDRDGGAHEDGEEKETHRRHDARRDDRVGGPHEKEANRPHHVRPGEELNSEPGGSPISWCLRESINFAFMRASAGVFSIFMGQSKCFRQSTCSDRGESTNFGHIKSPLKNPD